LAYVVLMGRTWVSRKWNGHIETRLLFLCYRFRKPCLKILCYFNSSRQHSDNSPRRCQTPSFYKPNSKIFNLTQSWLNQLQFLKVLHRRSNKMIVSGRINPSLFRIFLFFSRSI
jgi:hypothetical protein